MSEALTLSEALPEGYRMTELGPLPEEWRVVRLGKVFDIQQGKALSRKKDKGIRPRPFLRTANVLWGHIDLSTLDYMDFTPEEEEKYALQQGDLLVCEGGEIGRTAIWECQSSEIYYQNHLHRLRRKAENVEPHFYMYWFQAALTLLGLYGGTGNKTTIPNLSRTRLAAFPIPLPPLPEQRAIAHVLRAVQRAKEATEGVIAAARELKKSLMRHLFTYGPVPPGQADRVPVRETEIGPLPAHWRVVRLGEVVHKTRQIDLRKTPDQRFKYIDVSSVSNEQLAIVGYQVIYGKEAPSRARKEVEIGDVIFATVRPYLKRIAKITSEFDKQVCSTAFCVLRPRKHQIDNDFLFYAVSYEPFVARITEHQRGSSYPAVTDRDVLEEKIPLPPLPEQREITRILQAVDEKIRAEKGRKAALEVLFKTLLHDLMTAKRRLPAEFVARFAEPLSGGTP
ncbi:type I restriction enzyme, S subunit [Thermus arciformis]|uniref:Type I restriction enzyme, S subunit n=1 Tax=Thermus arciformis TaxID=482827 RepID=A0A1G7FJ22_9DEIN|nr:restriction endonuclease subunit S [Thermus arciformis]SDE75916.1 type I restriction enzyme, S subunit [Thermus arciformis]